MSKGKVKQKFSPLFNSDGSTKLAAQLPGRHPCQCLAGRHKLIGNCIRCGRIACAQEGSGPCFTCGALICTREEQEILLKGDRKSEELQAKLMGCNTRASTHSSKSVGLKQIASDLLPMTEMKFQKGLKKALEHKQQLLEYDRTSEQRTKIIDDDGDYFSVDSNQWLSKEDKERMEKHINTLKEKKYGSRRNQKITFDLAGRQIVDNHDSMDIYNENDYLDHDQQEDNSFHAQNSSWLSLNEAYGSKPSSSLVFEEVDGAHRLTRKLQVPFNEKVKLRLQDSELQQMSDDGWCISVHQPYASFIVLGIKKHEGRGWYTAHRGRLWVAAAGKQPTVQEVMLAEKAIKIIHGNTVFPEQYPTSCLLGCIDLVNCLPQEQYSEEFPDGESGSPYVFICERPQELMVKFPIQGKHKLYKMDERVHLAAVKMLLKKQKKTKSTTMED